MCYRLNSTIIILIDIFREYWQVDTWFHWWNDKINIVTRSRIDMSKRKILFFYFFLFFHFLFQSNMDVVFDDSHDYYQCHSLFSLTQVVYLIIKIDFTNIAIIIIYLHRSSYPMIVFPFSSSFSSFLLWFYYFSSLTNCHWTGQVYCQLEMRSDEIFSEDKVCSLITEVSLFFIMTSAWFFFSLLWFSYTCPSKKMYTNIVAVRLW